jgi:hypothetical protein
MTLLSVSTLCGRRWCSSAMTPTAIRESLRSSSGASLRSTSRSLTQSTLNLRPIGPISASPTSRSLMVMYHSLSQDLSPSAGSYISLGNSGRPIGVTGRRGSPLPRRAAVSAACHARGEDVPRVAPVETPPMAPSATRSRHEMTSATTVASLAIGPRSVDSHDVARPTSHR